MGHNILPGLIKVEDSPLFRPSALSAEQRACIGIHWSFSLSAAVLLLYRHATRPAAS